MSQNATPYGSRRRNYVPPSARQQRGPTTLDERPPPPPYSALHSVAPRSVVLTPPLPIDFLLLPLVGQSFFPPQTPQSGDLASIQLQASVVPPSSSAASCVDVEEKCTICYDSRAVWHCDTDATAACEECLDRLVRDMPPGPLCCPDCRRGQIPAQTVLDAVSPDMAARYRSRRAAGLRGDGNQWLQTAVSALKAGTTLPQLWTANVPAVPAGVSLAAEAAAQHEAQFVTGLAREAQDDVRRAWERIRCITDPAALQSELDQLEKDSLAIACPTAKMCPRCEYGPVLNTGCNDLAQHHGERQMSNCCRGCGFFGVSTDQWRPWDFVNRLQLPKGPATDISRLALCANVTEPEALEAIRDADGDVDAAYASLAEAAAYKAAFSRSVHPSDMGVHNPDLVELRVHRFTSLQDLEEFHRRRVLRYLPVVADITPSLLPKLPSQQQQQAAERRTNNAVVALPQQHRGAQ